MSIKQQQKEELPIRVDDNRSVDFKPITDYESLRADFRNMDLSTGPHLMKLARQRLQHKGILSSIEVKSAENYQIATVAGVVIIRQRPATARGFLFITLEDEFGFINIVVKPKMLEKYLPVVVRSSVILVRGLVEREHGVINVIGQHFIPLKFKGMDMEIKSRDFR